MVDLIAPYGAGISRWRTATNGLVAINVAVYLAMVASGVDWLAPTSSDLLRWGADGPNTLAGQYWRMITSGFLHIGIVHLLLNMWCLWYLGRLLERLLGPLTTVIVYVVTGVGASLLSLSWNPMSVSAGASGAIFGIAGVLIPVLYYGKLNLPPENVRRVLGYVVRFSLLNLLYGLRGHINNMAHLGGLVAGLAVGLFLARSFSLNEEERGTQRRNVIMVATVVVALLVIPVVKAKSYVVELGKGEASLEKEDYNSAIEHLKKYTAAQPNDAYGKALLGSALQGAKRYQEAAQEYEQGLALDPDYPNVQINLAQIYVHLNQPQKAVKLYQAGIQGSRPDADNYYNYALALKATGDLVEAEREVRQAIHLHDTPEAQSLLNEILKAQADAKAAVKQTAKNPKGKEPSSPTDSH
jgi:rhomboid protease GluP